MSTRGYARGKPHADSQVTGLLLQVARGDEAALEALYQHFHCLVFAWALEMLQDRTAAEEVVQDVFLRLWRSASRFDPRRGSLVSWLLSITHNRAIDQLRRKVLPRTDSEELDRAEEEWGRMPADFETPEECAWRRMASAEVRQAVSQLQNQHYRQVIELSFFEELSVAEVARRIGCPEGTVKSRKSSAVELLRRALTSP
ncbi:MAG: sigma-70 family RNA polymerase sigma factor [Deinococcus sp.]|nr:sigma-70 family RNA polymerase sigma factor [Deinococcus sp.]